MLTLLALIASSVVRNNSGNSDTQTDRAETERKKSISVLPDDCKFDPPVYLQRYDRVRNVLRQESNVKKIVDLGCAEGNFIKYLKNVEGVEEISAVDVDSNCLTSALNRSHPLAWDYLMGRHKPLKIKIYNGNVLKTDSRLCNYDAVTCIELIEHLHLEDIDGLVRNVFGYIKPRLAIFTTPNADFNVLFGPSEHLRHWDHKFEWNRQEFRSW
ncbi:HENMT1 (predicted) [Pycnogonum litorale]